MRLARLPLQTMLLIPKHLRRMLEDGRDERGSAAHGEVVSVHESVQLQNISIHPSIHPLIISHQTTLSPTEKEKDNTNEKS